jgi:hypothetical protein
LLATVGAVDKVNSIAKLVNRTVQIGMRVSGQSFLLDIKITAEI